MHERRLSSNSVEEIAFDDTESAGSSSLLDVALIGSALTFSGRMVGILQAEFPELRFRRFASPAELEAESPCVRLIVIELGSSFDVVDLIRNLRIAFPEASLAIAYTSLNAAPGLRDRSALASMMPALSILPMKVSLEAWLSIFRLLLCGEHFIPAEVIHAWNQSPAGEHDPEPIERDPVRPAPAPAIALTPREMQVLPLMAEGKQNKMIADALGLSEHTVKLHTHNIFVKLKVNNRTCAAEWYRSYSQAARRQRSDRDDGASHPR